MKSKNATMTCKNKFLSFMNKSGWLINSLMIIAVIGATLYLLFADWTGMPMFLKIVWPILSLIALIGTLITLFNGMYISKKGTIVFVPDLRIKKFQINEIKTIVFNFTEWKNNKYSVKIDIVYKDGKIFIKDYSDPYKSMKNFKLGMSLYTIKYNNVKRILNQISELDFCTFFIMDQFGFSKELK